MKIFLTVLTVSACVLGVGTAVPGVSAHTLIPPEVLEYLERNPDATLEEIDAILNEQSTGRLSQSHQRLVLQYVRREQRGFLANAVDFTRVGIIHILGGLDHVLFVLAILMTFTTLWGLLKLVTTFTVAHSVTLIVAGLGLLTLTSRIVEPVIALSIAYVAMTTVFLRHISFFASVHSKVSTIFFFGLFHGLGFAGLLTDLSVPRNKFVSSLLFFNVGVEIGQLVILAVAVPVLLWLRKQRWHGAFLKLFAAGISVVAAVWFVERMAA